MTRAIQITATLALLLVVVVPGLWAAEGTPDLPQQVLDMLRADLSEELILEWLGGHDGPVARPSARDLIEIKEAGASEELLRRLISLAGAERAALPQPGREEATDEGSSEEAGPAPGEPPPPTGKPKVAADRTPKADDAAPRALVAFRLSYRPRDEDLEDLIVYLDGIPLSYVPASSTAFGNSPGLEFQKRLEAGTHTLRVALEEHEKNRKGVWRHDARMAPESFVFTLDKGPQARVELTFHQSVLNYLDPLGFQAIQGESVHEVETAGGDPDSWPAICEDIRAGLESGARSAKRASRDLEGCVDWSGLWPEGSAPSREEVREAMEAFDFRPVPRGS